MAGHGGLLASDAFGRCAGIGAAVEHENTTRDVAATDIEGGGREFTVERDQRAQGRTGVSKLEHRATAEAEIDGSGAVAGHARLGREEVGVLAGGLSAGAVQGAIGAQESGGLAGLGGGFRAHGSGVHISDGNGVAWGGDFGGFGGGAVGHAHPIEHDTPTGQGGVAGGARGAGVKARRR